MAHFLPIEDDRGELVDLITLCSDSCHREFARREELEYGGWYGAQELEQTGFCANCGVVVPGIETDCDEQLMNVVVNRFLSDSREYCETHNPPHIIQLSRDDLGR